MKKSETRTYWMVCQARGDGQWILHGFWHDSLEIGQQKLRWLRQWHPQAFLVCAEMTQCNSESPLPPLPIRSPMRSPEPQPNEKPRLHLV